MPKVSDYLLDKFLGDGEQTAEEMLAVAMGIDGLQVVDDATGERQ